MITRDQLEQLFAVLYPLGGGIAPAGIPGAQLVAAAQLLQGPGKLALRRPAPVPRWLWGVLVECVHNHPPLGHNSRARRSIWYTRAHSDARARDDHHSALSSERTMGNPGRGAGGGWRVDYTAVGHVTADVLADGSRQAGGGAFYSALQAARLGLSTRIITRGVAAEIESLLEPYRSELELELEVLPGTRTTVLETFGQGAQRTQRLLSWAGPIGESVDVDTAILHLAPVARETGPRWRGHAGFVGLTPQGLVRAWASEGTPVTRVPLQEQLLPRRFDAIVISEQERESCAVLIDSPGPVLAVTAAARATTLRLGDGERRTVAVPAIGALRDDLGAGDVFAAAFFVALREGRPAEAAASFANAAAAIRIEGLGASAIGSRAQIDARTSGPE